jgi:hypothetical protein
MKFPKIKVIREILNNVKNENKTLNSITEDKINKVNMQPYR